MQEKATLITFISVIVLIIILMVCLGAIVRLYQKKQHAFKRELEEMRSRYEQEFLKSKIELQEQTLEHISFEIHDNIGQFISLAKLHINTIDARADPVVSDKVCTAVGLLTCALDDLRNITRGLSLEHIRAGGLERAIASQVSQVEKTGRFAATFDVKGNYNFLEEQKEIILFRIFQEALNNIIRHSHASSMSVLLDAASEDVTLEITDNGVGFEMSWLFEDGEMKAKTGGLSHMIARARVIDAEIKILSAKGAGTSVRITVPKKFIYDTNGQEI